MTPGPVRRPFSSPVLRGEEPYAQTLEDEGDEEDDDDEAGEREGPVEIKPDELLLAAELLPVEPHDEETGKRAGHGTDDDHPDDQVSIHASPLSSPLDQITGLIVYLFRPADKVGIRRMVSTRILTELKPKNPDTMGLGGRVPGHPSFRRRPESITTGVKEGV